MENDKSPGIDGLTTNFYKHFWPLIADSVTQVYNYTFRVGHLTETWNYIPFIQERWLNPTQQLETHYFANHWLEDPYKTLANRLQKVLPFLVHTDQTASILGRTINNNLRLLHDIIYYANENDIPLAVISVDQLKPFDRVSHRFYLKP